MVTSTPARGIPPELERAILEQAGKKRTTREISAWLAEEHGISVSHVTVGKFLRAAREERADVAKNVLREKLSGSLTSDIDRLERFARKCAILANKNKHDPKAFVMLVGELRKITDTKLHYSGADESDEPSRIVLEWPDARRLEDRAPASASEAAGGSSAPGEIPGSGGGETMG